MTHLFSFSASRRAFCTLLFAAAVLSPVAAPAQTGDFALRSGDRVVFYGDSITDQRQYTIMTEDFVVTRFPTRDIRFVHSGWGGDRVTGGGGGKIDTRLDRDVVAYKPTVVTIMLGMNDGSYRAFDQNIFDTFAKGFVHIADKLQADLPGVRLTFIQPSPFDDVTRAPGFPGGYNGTLKKYAGYLAELATTKKATIADLNTPTVAMLTRANQTSPELAQKIIPDRVHPGGGGHLIMAQGLLAAWNAPALVSSVSVDAQTVKASAQNARVSNIAKTDTGGVSWNCVENALPFPLQTDGKDPAYTLALQSSDFVQTLDREMLTVTGLTAPRYDLTIDGAKVGTFSKDELTAGVNLAPLSTPMLKQAQTVSVLTRKRSDAHNARWRTYQVPFADDKAVAQSVQKVIVALDALDEDLRKERMTAAQPVAHSFALVPSVAANP